MQVPTEINWELQLTLLWCEYNVCIIEFYESLTRCLINYINQIILAWILHKIADVYGICRNFLSILAHYSRNVVECFILHRHNGKYFENQADKFPLNLIMLRAIWICSASTDKTNSTNNLLCLCWRSDSWLQVKDEALSKERGKPVRREHVPPSG